MAAKPPAGVPLTDLSPGLLLLGLVNAHTHLELSFLTGAVPPSGDSVDWLHQLVAARLDVADIPPNILKIRFRF